MTENLEPKIESVKLTGGGDWLQISYGEMGIEASCHLYGHRNGSFGDITFKGINKTCAESLLTKLALVIAQWDTLEEKSQESLKQTCEELEEDWRRKNSR